MDKKFVVGIVLMLVAGALLPVIPAHKTSSIISELIGLDHVFIGFAGKCERQLVVSAVYLATGFGPHLN